jgi:hypothetical protein
MCNSYVLQLSQSDAHKLSQHLYPGDGNESVAIAACSYELTSDAGLFRMREVFPVPSERCLARSPWLVEWRVADIEDFLATQTELARVIAVFHSHPNGHACFSDKDDIADRAFHAELIQICGPGNLLMSAIMLPDTTILARVVHEQGQFSAVHEVRVLAVDTPPLS